MNKIILRNNHSEYHTTIKYPDGQKSIRIDLEKLNPKKFVTIECSIKNFDEIEVLLCLAAALQRNDFIIQEIDFIYLYGLRSDRVFESGQPNYLFDVLSPILRRLPGEINILLPHSQRSACIGNQDMAHAFFCKSVLSQNMDSYFIGGDESCNFEICDLNFSKKRGLQGNISISLSDNNKEKLIDRIKKYDSIFIIDDLIDGGWTFIKEAEYIRNLGYKGKLNLAIMHALFTQGISQVADHFDQIVCSNSYQDIEHPKVRQINVWSTEND